MISTKDTWVEICNSRKYGHQLTDEEIEKLHIRLFRMYRDLEAVCRKHNLRISLAYGNVIGALRHGGWIPWDDDLDVHMPREDYDKLLSLYADELPAIYQLYAPHTPHGPSYRFAKMVDTSTRFVPLGSNVDPKFHQGVYIDIFPVENINTNRFANKLRKYWSFFLSYTATSVAQVETKSESYRNLMYTTKAGRLNYRFRHLWGTIFSFAGSRKWYTWIDNFHRCKRHTGYVHVPTDIAPYSWKPLPEKMFFPTQEIEYGNEGKALIPGMPEEYLTLVYGEWNVIPPADKIWHHYIEEIEIPD